MPIDRNTAIQHLSDVLADFERLEQMGWDVLRDERHHEVRVIARMKAAIERLAPPESWYFKEAFNSANGNVTECQRLGGVLQALLADYQGDYLQTFLELAHAELYDDFLAMAEFLLSQDFLKDPAAVLAGGVLEEQLRKLCDKHSIPVTSVDSNGVVRPKKLDTMNAELAKQGVYGKNEQKQITAWAGVRNSAAHAKYQEYDLEHVELMVQGIRGFVSRFPA